MSYDLLIIISKKHRNTKTHKKIKKSRLNWKQIGWSKDTKRKTVVGFL